MVEVHLNMFGYNIKECRPIPGPKPWECEISLPDGGRAISNSGIVFAVASPVKGLLIHKAYFEYYRNDAPGIIGLFFNIPKKEVYTLIKQGVIKEV